jgi:DNA polymerase-1
MSKDTLVLVDGHSLAYRAYHALPNDLQSPSGELTNASYGFTLMLLSVLEDEDPDYIIVAFDKGPSFRVEEYEAYKAHREKMPDEMRGQMSRIREIVSAFGIPIVELEDYEADDVLGTLSDKASDEDLQVLIVTGDRDALQLVSDQVTVLTSGRRFSDTRRYTPEKVREKYGLDPEQLIDYKALIGDRSDNIPGVRGVGEKGGEKLLKKYNTLDCIYEHLDEITTRYQNALRKHKEDAYLSRKLGKIVRDAPVTLDLGSAKRNRGFDRSEVMRIMQDLGFRTLFNRVSDAMPAVSEKQEQQLSLFDDDAVSSSTSVSTSNLGTYHLVSDEEALHHLAQRLEDAAEIAFDTETTDTDAMAADLVGISLTDAEEEAWYIPVRAPESDETLSLEVVQAYLAPVFSDDSILKIGHNLKYDMEIVSRFGMPIQGPLFDTMVAEWILNPDASLGLKNQAWIRLGVQMTEIKELIGTGRSQRTMDAVELARVVPYACADADMTLRLAHVIKPELEAREQLDLFQDLEMKLLPVLTEMELTGIEVDVDWMEALSSELDDRLTRLEKEIHNYAGMDFNVNSTQQLSDVLFETLGLSTRGTRKTKTGHYSTRASVLEGLRGDHPIIEAILDYRELSKLKSTYVDSLPDLINEQTGRIHTSYNPTGTVTGRISSSNPNLQNIPIRTEEGRRVRRAFVAEDGWLLVGADYSQIELRVMAHVSQDESMIDAFRRDEDIHATTAAAVFGVSLDEVSYDQRRIAKAVNFGLIYGQSAYGLARQLDLGFDEAQSFIDRYFERFPGVQAYMERIKKVAEEQGYVETLLNRRRYFPELAEGNRVSSRRRQAALRMVINTPIQGTAADIIKLAMIRMDGMLKEKDLRARMLLQVHDEVVLEVPEAEIEETLPIIRSTMRDAFNLVVPLKIDVEIGPNWQEMS